MTIDDPYSHDKLPLTISNWSRDYTNLGRNGQRREDCSKRFVVKGLFTSGYSLSLTLCVIVKSKSIWSRSLEVQIRKHFCLIICGVGFSDISGYKHGEVELSFQLFEGLWCVSTISGILLWKEKRPISF